MSNSNILGTYSPEDVTCVISNSNFTHTISGFSANSIVSATRVVPASTLYTGADGTNSRTIRSVKNMDLTFTLSQTSESNDILSQLLLLDEQSRNNDNLFGITIKDNSGRTLISSPTCFIGTTPDVSFADAIGERQWVLHCVGGSVFIGGNSKFTQGGWSASNDLGNDPGDYWKPAGLN